MAVRNLLHINHLESFAKWLLKNGWKLEEPKGDYEVLRARKGKTFFPVYRKHGSDHLPIEDRFVGLVKKYLKSH